MLETYIGTIETLNASIGAQRVNIGAYVNVGAPLSASIGMLETYIGTLRTLSASIVLVQLSMQHVCFTWLNLQECFTP